MSLEGRSTNYQQSQAPSLQRGRALVVFNPVAGSGNKIAAGDVVKTLDEAGWAASLFATSDHDDLRRLLRERLDQESSELDLVVAFGGDGTVGMAAESVARHSATVPVSLGIVPGGTANVLARELGIPMNPREALELIAGAHRRVAIDGMRVGSRLYFLQIGVGLDALMIRDTSPVEKRRIGRLAYMRTLIHIAIGYEAHTFVFNFDDTWARMRAWQVLLANAGTLGVAPFTWGPSISPSDGVLDLCVYHVRGPVDWLKLGARVLTGHHRRDTNQRYFRVHREIRLWASEPIPVQADGEIIGPTPISVVVVPGALSILAPEKHQ